MEQNTGMWEWFLEELYVICQLNGVSKTSGAEKDDVVQDVCVRLLKAAKKDAEGEEYVREIYEKGKINLLYTLVRRVIFESKSRLYFDGTNARQEFSSYRKIKEVCDTYEIKAIPENAYKISELIDDEKRFSIRTVERLLHDKKQMHLSLELEALNLRKVGMA